MTMEPNEQVWTDGYYRFNDGEASFIGYVHNGVIGDDPIEYYLGEDAYYGPHTIEPVHVLTQAEYDNRFGWKPVELHNEGAKAAFGALIMSVDMTGECGPYALMRRVPVEAQDE
jgi:hypothetical protein